jgi:hypothetical protein
MLKVVARKSIQKAEVTKRGKIHFFSKFKIPIIIIFMDKFYIP